MVGMMGDHRHEELLKRMEKQKNLKLKDYLRLASLSINNKKERNKGNLTSKSVYK